MRIDVITLHAVQNYGSALQALATQELLKKHGCDVRIINYVRENVRPENLLKTWGKGNIVKMIVMLPTVIRWKKVFSQFIRDNLNITPDVLTFPDDFKSYVLDADAYCTGSDQVWNSKWNRGVIPSLYLDFVPDTFYKFSFSASFGQDVLSEDEVRLTEKYINQYKKISVRESSAKRIIENQYGYKEATQLVDPTVCVSGEFWRKYASPRKIKDEYILIYNLNRSKEFDNYAVALAKKAGLKLVRFCTRYDQFYRPGKCILVPEVYDFISMIDNAKYVLTDSFHASAFAMNLGTEPICVYPKDFGGRIQSFLELTESTQRHAIDYNDYDILNRPVDFDNVNLILKHEREKAEIFIKDVIKDINIHIEN